MVDLTWISTEARSIHDFFVSIFYLLAGLLLALGVLLEYFKLPLGGTPAFPQLLGRTLVAAILLVAYPEISNAVAAVADSVADKLGGFNNIHIVLEKAGETLKKHSWSWTSIGDTLIWIVTYLAYFFLFVTVFFFDAAVIYCMALLYIFSPVLIVFYILPQTAVLTGGLFRSLFEIAAWKIVWSVLATLLWSSALNNFNQPETLGNFVVQLALTLMLTYSILKTPIVVKSLISGAISSVAAQAAGYAALTMTAGAASPAAVSGFIQKKGLQLAKGGLQLSSKGIQSSRKFMTEYKARKAAANNPKANP